MKERRGRADSSFDESLSRCSVAASLGLWEVLDEGDIIADSVVGLSAVVRIAEAPSHYVVWRGGREGRRDVQVVQIGLRVAEEREKQKREIVRDHGKDGLIHLAVLGSLE